MSGQVSLGYDKLGQLSPDEKMLGQARPP